MNSHPDVSVEKLSGESRRVLLVDDDKKFCRLLSEYLKPLGYEATAVHTGPDGVEQALAGQWHAVILDLMLPGFDGLEVLRHVKCHPTLHRTPIVVLTTSDAERDVAAAYEYHANSFVTKPVDLSRLSQLIQDLGFYRPARNGPAPGTGDA